MVGLEIDDGAARTVRQYAVNGLQCLRVDILQLVAIALPVLVAHASDHSESVAIRKVKGPVRVDQTSILAKDKRRMRGDNMREDVDRRFFITDSWKHGKRRKDPLPMRKVC